MDHRGSENPMRKTLIVFLVSLSCTVAHSFFPEYEHYSAEESAEINGPRQVGSEYESDRLTYQFLSDWSQSFASGQENFQYTAGSLGPTRFFTQGRMRLLRELTPWLDFQVSYAETGSLKEHRRSLVFEFYFTISESLKISIYGEPSTLKKQDDVGVATTIKTSESSQLRLFHTWVDFSHNKRNEQSDQYQSQPDAVGGIWRWAAEESYIQTSYRHDFSAKKVFPNGRIYQYGGDRGQWLSRHALGSQKNHYLQSEFNYSKTHEADNINTDQGVSRWENQTLDGMMQIQNPNSRFRLYGLRVLYSQWESSTGNVIHNDILPHFWFTPWRIMGSLGQHNIDIGYEFNWHRGQGPINLRSTLDKRDQMEHRMNWRYRLVGFRDLHLNMLLTFDLDEVGTGETWEGGALQFATDF